MRSRLSASLPATATRQQWLRLSPGSIPWSLYSYLHLPTTPALLFLGYFSSVQLEQILRLLALIDKVPFLSVMISIDDGKDDALEVASGETGAGKEIEGDGFAVRRSSGGHAGLAARTAGVGEEQAVGTVEMNHADHVDHDRVGAFFLDFAHERNPEKRLRHGQIGRAHV